MILRASSFFVLSLTFLPRVAAQATLPLPACSAANYYPVQILYFTSNQFSNNTLDGVGYDDANIDVQIPGCRCCATGFCVNGHKLALVPQMIVDYTNVCCHTYTMLPGYNLSFVLAPSMYEWTKQPVCQQCLKQNPANRALWSGTALGLSMQYLSRTMHRAQSAPGAPNCTTYASVSNIVSAVIPIMVGPTYTDEALELATLAAQFNVAVISYSTFDLFRTTEAGGAVNYPNLFSMVPVDSSHAPATTAVLQNLVWINNINIVYINSSWAQYLADEIATKISTVLKGENPILSPVLEDFANMSTSATWAYNDTSRVVILIGRETTVASGSTAVDIRNPVFSMLCLMAQTSFATYRQDDLGLIIVPEQKSDLLIDPMRVCYDVVNKQDCSCSHDQMQAILRGAIMIGPLYGRAAVEVDPLAVGAISGTNQAVASIIANLQNLAAADSTTTPDSTCATQNDKFLYYAFDAAMAAARALDSYATSYLQQNSGPFAYSTDDVLDKMNGIVRSLPSFNGTTGLVQFDAFQNRIANTYAYQLDQYPYATDPDVDTNDTKWMPIRLIIPPSTAPRKISSWVWHTPSGYAPVTWRQSTLFWKNQGGYIVGSIVIAIFTPLFYQFGFIPYLKHRRIKNALAGRWDRNPDLLRKIITLDDPGQKILTRATHHYKGTDENAIDVYLHSNHGAYRLLMPKSKKNRRLKARRDERHHRHHHKNEDDDDVGDRVVVIINVARDMRGATNVTKQLTRDMVKKSKTLFMQLIAMQSMVGKRNVAQFYGCVFSPEIVGTLYQWQPNGTLQQLINSAPFDLDLELTLSLISDVVRGVESLYSNDLAPHGRISSKVIFLTTKFDCQIANYGLPGFRDGFAPNWRAPDLLWSSPEILQNTSRAPSMGTKESDIWSVSVIITELVNHETPYARLIALRDGEAVVDDVAAGLIRPELLSNERSTAGLEKLISRMTCFNPVERITLPVVAQTLKSLIKAENVQPELFSEKVLSHVTDWTDRLEIVAQRMLCDARHERARLVEA